MKFIKETQTLVISKTDAIYDVVIQCWCVPLKNERDSYYEMPNETTTEVQFDEFLGQEEILRTLINRLIEISNQEKDKTHIYRIYIGWLILFQLQNDLDPKDVKATTQFKTMLSNIQSRSKVVMPNDFEFSELKKYKKKKAEEILENIILYDLIRAEKGILKPTKLEKQSKIGSKIKRASRIGSDILKNATETARANSPFRRSRSGSIQQGTSPSKLQISAPISRDDNNTVNNDNDQAAETYDEATERSRLLPPEPARSKNQLNSNSRVAESKIQSNLQPTAPQATFFKPAPQGDAQNTSIQRKHSLPPSLTTTHLNNLLPSDELTFMTLYDKVTNEIKITCPNQAVAQLIQNKFGPSVAKRIFCTVSITPQNWLTHKANFIANLEPEYAQLIEFIEKTYCSVMGFPYKPPATKPLPVVTKSLNDEPEDEEEKSEKCCFCF